MEITDCHFNQTSHHYSFVEREELIRLFDLTVDLLCILSVDGYIKTLNPSWERTLGYMPEELRTKPYLNFVHPDDQEKTQQAMQLISKGENIRHFENRYRCKDGTYKWLMWNTTVHNELVYCIARDITAQKEMENKLKESEDRYRRLVQLSPDMIVVNTDDNILFVNDTGFKILGAATLEELNKSPIKDFINNYADENVDWPGDYVLQTLNGNEIEMEMRRTTITFNAKPATLTVLRDNSTRKSMEKELRLNQHKYRIIEENMSDLIGVLDVSGIIRYASPSHLKVLGTLPEDKNVFDLIHPADLPVVKSLFKEMLASKLPGVAELRYKHFNGHYIVIEANATPVIGARGEVVNIVVIARDITDRRKAEAALQESEKQLRTLINALPDCVFLKDGAGRWLEANFAALRTFDLQNIAYKGKKDLQLANYSRVPREAFVQCQQSDEDTWKAKEIIQLEEVILQPNGELKTFEITKVPTFYPDGNRKGLVVIGRDITERKKTEEIINKTEKLAVVGELAAGIAHEIRNPLTSLLGFTQLLQQSQQGTNGQYYDIMLSELNRINLIVGEFLLLAKPHILNFEMRDLPSILLNVTTLLESETNKNNVQIYTEIGPNIPLIRCEENQLKQVFINILKNAIDATPTGGHIFIKVKTERNQVVIQFTDYGCGISQERMAKLGEPFYTTKEKGTGLGLTVSYKIIENHHGKIQVRSELNKGTVVRIVLPV